MTKTDIPFGATSTAEEVLSGIDLTGKRAIVTGGAGGLGRETARVLAQAGAEVTIAARNLQTARQVAADLNQSSGSSTIRASALDLADLKSVRWFVDGWAGPLDILVANAGIMATPEAHTRDGRELQFATNHLGHFALANALHPNLLRATAARVVVVSSVGHINGPVRFDDLDFTKDPYDPWLAYAQSKTANILFAVEAAKRWACDDICVNALNPGRIWETDLGRYIENPPTSFDPSGATGVSEKNIAQGAATSVLLAGSLLVEGITGKYFEDCVIAAPYVPGVRRGVAEHALNEDAAARLWDLSADFIS